MFDKHSYLILGGFYTCGPSPEPAWPVCSRSIGLFKLTCRRVCDIYLYVVVLRLAFMDFFFLMIVSIELLSCMHVLLFCFYV
jgi:hypothetical protein